MRAARCGVSTELGGTRLVQTEEGHVGLFGAVPFLLLGLGVGACGDGIDSATDVPYVIGIITLIVVRVKGRESGQNGCFVGRMLTTVREYGVRGGVGVRSPEMQLPWCVAGLGCAEDIIIVHVNATVECRLRWG